MFTFENVRHCMWRNVYSPQPVLAGTIVFGGAFAWTTERLSPSLLSAFAAMSACEDEDFVVMFGIASIATVDNYRQAFREMRARA